MASPERVRVAKAARALLGPVDSAHQAAALSRVKFTPLRPMPVSGRVTAIDGGQSLVVNLGVLGLIAIRAGYSTRLPNDRFLDVTTYSEARELVRRDVEAEWNRLVRLYAQDWPSPPPLPSGPHWLSAWAEAERSLAEFDAAQKALRSLEAGDLLLVDGSLDPALLNASWAEAVGEAARRRGVHVVGVTKDTSVTIGGDLPFTLELEDAARRQGAPALFAADVTDLVGGPERFRTFGIRLDSRSPVYRVDVAAAEGGDSEAVLGRLAALSNDVAYPGYPYVLARIHDRVHFSEDESMELKAELESLVAERRGSLYSFRLFGRGRDVLANGG